MNDDGYRLWAVEGVTFEFWVMMLVVGYFIRFKDSFDSRTGHNDTGIDKRQNSLLLPKEKGPPTWTPHTGAST